MLQRVLCGYTTPISKFKSNPNAALAEANGDAVAVSSHNAIQFYAVPAHLYEELINFVEYAQRGTSDLNNIPARFSGADLDMNSLAKTIAKTVTNDTNNDEGEFKEW